jgi:N-acetylglucosamine-6-phosphate deacetylase
MSFHRRFATMADMTDRCLLFRGGLVLADRTMAAGQVLVRDGRIAEIAEQSVAGPPPAEAEVIDAGEGWIAPGYVDLHVHGGAGADFMDGSDAAFATVLAAHARHGTTSIVPTSTAARHEQVLAMLACSRRARDAALRNDGPPSARVLGAHLYGPYFRREARGCHPAAPVRDPAPGEYQQYLDMGVVLTASIAPELTGAEAFTRACLAHGVRMNAGHTHATFDEMAEAVRWGVRHVDHLYCAMSDKTKLRQRQPYPMQGGVLEATLYFDELTTEVIADGKHLSPDLLRLALKLKGPDRLALVTDCNRALDMPDGTYIFGPSEDGEPFVHEDGVGKMPDRQGLASSVRGMDHMVRTFVAQTGVAVCEAVRMASLTPARIVGHEGEIGSIEVGKRADLLMLDRELNVEQVYVGGRRIGADAACD